MLANVSPKDERRSSLLYSGPTQPIPKKSLQIRTDKPRPHVCTICTRAFARLEHLKRHERSHTNEKPYQCATCGRCFARRDLVLRHQQKLHLQMLPGIRRGLVPLAAVSETSPPPGSDNIIILQHNTNAKAPLPNGLRMNSYGGGNLSALSPSHVSASPVDPQVEKIKQTYGYLLLGAIPLPKTTSSHNTPSGTFGKVPMRSNSAELDPTGLATAQVGSTFTQQPSPLNGDSPDLKEKKKYPWSSLVPDALHHSNSYRHSSFLAVLGTSYANVADALSILSHQIMDVPTQVEFSTPQLTATELDAKGFLGLLGLPELDLGNYDLDWFNQELDNKNVSTKTSNQGNNSSGKLSSTPNVFRKLATIRSEKDLEQNYFANDVVLNHQYHDPAHPHHIKGTSAYNFDDVSHIENKHVPSGTGFIDFVNELHSATNGGTVDPYEQARTMMEMGMENSAIDQLAMKQALQSNASPDFNQASQNQGNAASRKQKRTSSTKRNSLSSSASANDSKRYKTGFVNDTADLDWLKESQEIPIMNELCASHDTGFIGIPYLADQFEQDEVLDMFKFRQEDLVKQRSHVDTRLSPEGSERLSISFNRKPSKAQFTIGDRSDFTADYLTDGLRDEMYKQCNMKSKDFPSLEDLNNYMMLYEKEFNKYFPFIHLPSFRIPDIDNLENIPLFLAMCSLGALYSYHDNNLILLFTLSKRRVYNFLERVITPKKLSEKKVPIMAHQSLVLLIFISMFLNEPNMAEKTSRLIKTMVGLINTTNFQNPLEMYSANPDPITNPKNEALIIGNFDYFIMVQSRIRTINTFYLLEVVRNTLTGLSVPMKGFDIFTGTQCGNDKLWFAADHKEWFEEYQKCGMPKLVEFANNETLVDLMTNIYDQPFPQSSMSIQKSLTMLMAIHEKILDVTLSRCLDTTAELLKWRTNTRPELENLVSAWERFFHRSGGFDVVSDQNSHVLRSKGELQMILPLLALAKMRLNVDVAPFMEPVISKDWTRMEQQLYKLEEDVEELKAATEHALYILDLWARNISVLHNPKKTSVRTPVYFVSCICVAVMVLAKTLNVIENLTLLSINDMTLWLNAEKVLRGIETALTRSEGSYADFLHKQSHGVFDYVWTEEFTRNVERVIQAFNNGDKDGAFQVRKCKLLVQALSLGVRILADAPLWPIAMGFAEGLKNMALQIFGKDTK